jgi:hypothetical protein
MSANYTEIDKKITDFIFEKPEVVAQLLKDNGYSLPSKLTLDVITSSVFKALYEIKDQKFINQLDSVISNGNYASFEPISMGISAALSIGSALLGNSQAKKALALQRKIALAQLSQQKMLEEEKIRVGAETERTRILINSLQQYQSDLQTQSTQRLKDAGIYVVMLGLAVGIVYGVSILLMPKTK